VKGTGNWLRKNLQETRANCDFNVPADVDDNFDPEPDLVVYIEIGCKIDSCL